MRRYKVEIGNGSQVTADRGGKSFKAKPEITRASNAKTNACRGSLKLKGDFERRHSEAAKCLMARSDLLLGGGEIPRVTRFSWAQKVANWTRTGQSPNIMYHYCLPRPHEPQPPEIQVIRGSQCTRSCCRPAVQEVGVPGGEFSSGRCSDSIRFRSRLRTL